MTRIALVLVLSLGSTVHAAPATPASASAKKLYVSGTNHYELSEFDAALADFREAYRLKDDPVFLFNIAQCYRQLHQPEQAVQFYKTFLRRVPGASNRAEVEARIDTLEQEMAARSRPEPAQPPTQAQPAPVVVPVTVVATAPARKKPVYKTWWLWTAVGGAVAVGLGVGLGVGLTRSHHDTTFNGVQF